jgi:hypothetical protein
LPQSACDESDFRELLQFALHRAHARPQMPGDLAHIERLIRPAIEQGENAAPDLAKQDIGERVVCCTHYENNCIFFENIIQLK